MVYDEFHCAEVTLQPAGAILHEVSITSLALQLLFGLFLLACGGLMTAMSRQDRPTEGTSLRASSASLCAALALACMAGREAPAQKKDVTFAAASVGTLTYRAPPRFYSRIIAEGNQHFKRPAPNVAMHQP
jgi:hypothetical protein